MRFLLLIIVLLIIYGSVYPFNFSTTYAGPWAWHIFLNNWNLTTSRGDVLGNLGLFFPFGLVGILALKTVNQLWARAGLVLLLGFVLAFILQVVQIYVPARSPALSDVLWNQTGIALGITIGLLVEKRARSLQRGALPSFSLPLGLLIVWFAAELLPLVPSLDLQGIKDSLKPLLIDPEFSTLEAYFQAAGVILVGRLLAEVVGAPASIRVLPALIVVLLLGKVLIVTLVLDMSTCVGIGAGYICWWIMHGWREPGRSKTIFIILFSAYTLSALMPFALRSAPADFNWIPFASVLRGSMLTNVQALADRLVIYGGLLWLLQALGGRLAPGSMALALWVVSLEAGQMLVQGRTATISEPLWVLIVAVVIARISRLAVSPSPRAQGIDALSSKPCATESAPVDTEATAALRATGLTKPTLWVGVACVALTGLLYVALRAPGIPYNVRELFLDGGSLLYLLGFSIALLWIGAGGYWMGSRLAGSRYPYLVLPMLAAFTSIISLLTLGASVTRESISDITGSNNLYWFVVNKDIWGTQAAALFAALDAPGLVGFFERPIRYTALYGPLVIFLGLIFAVTEPPIGRVRVIRRTFFLLVSALPWLWLCKAIAFDWSSTDNLNELIARDGQYGLGGGGYLYILLALICMNAVALARFPLRAKYMVLVSVLTAAAVGIGWILINLGLEQRIEKYGRVFSGVQFLLGPDRSRLLPDSVLLLRWAIVYTGAVAIIATGARLAWPFLQRIQLAQAVEGVKINDNMTKYKANTELESSGQYKPTRIGLL